MSPHTKQECCECEIKDYEEGKNRCLNCGLPLHQQKSRTELVEEIVEQFEYEFPTQKYRDVEDVEHNLQLDFLRSALLRISDASMDVVKVEEKIYDGQQNIFDAGFNAARTSSQEKRTLFVK